LWTFCYWGSRDDIRTPAYEYAIKNGIKGFSVNKQKAGYYWFDGFMSRFPDLVVKSAENLSVPRAMGMNATQVCQWFLSNEGILQRLGIYDCPNHIWNFDERGCQNIHFAQEIVGQVGVPTHNIQFYCDTVPLSYMIDERKLLFYRKISLSKNVILRINTFPVNQLTTSICLPGVSSDYMFLCSKYGVRSTATRDSIKIQ